VGYAFYAGEPVDTPELRGPAVEKIAANGEQAQADAIVRRVRELIVEEGLSFSDIVVLLAIRPKAAAYEMLQARGLPGGIGWAVETRGPAGRAVFVDTVARFKGLESQAVLLWMGDEVIDEEQWGTVDGRALTQ